MPDVVYADYQSSKPVDPRVVEAMLPYFAGTFGNAASLHAVGDDATAALDEARAAVARVVGARIAPQAPLLRQDRQPRVAAQVDGDPVERRGGNV